MLIKKSLFVSVVCSMSFCAASLMAQSEDLTPSDESKLPVAAAPPVEKAAEQGSDEIRAAAQFLSLYMNVLDCENVGYIQTGEADEHFAPIFLSSDIDSSRTLSKKELLNNPFSRKRALMGVAFTQMDRNTDGAATSDELRLYLNKAVESVDSDNNGDVYPEELEYAQLNGAVLVSDTPITAPKKPKQPDFIPPWIRHAKALKHKQAAGQNAAHQADSSSSTPAVEMPQP